MRLRIALLRLMLQRITAPTVAFFFVAAHYVLLKPKPLSSIDGWAAVLVFAHSYLLTSSLGRPADKDFAFTLSRGYSRDTLWLNTMIVTTISVLAVWLPAALIVWTPLRSILHDAIFRSPHFPIMAPLEKTTPLAWLAWYVLLLPLFHYEWIRWAQPTRGAFGATLIQAGIVLVVYPLIVTSPWPSWLIRWAPGGLVALGAFIASRRLYSRLEVPA